MSERTIFIAIVGVSRANELFVFWAVLAQIKIINLFFFVFEKCFTHCTTLLIALEKKIAFRRREKREKSEYFRDISVYVFFGATLRETFTGINDSANNWYGKTKNFATEATQREFINTQLGSFEWTRQVKAIDLSLTNASTTAAIAGRWQSSLWVENFQTLYVTSLRTPLVFVSLKYHLQTIPHRHFSFKINFEIFPHRNIF